MTRSLASLLLTASLVAAPLAAQADDEPPNVVLFLVDDMGWQDTSVPFHTERTPFNDRYRTPHMERLAERGMKFTQAYVHAICSPTRVSLMTGQNAARHGVTNWTLRKNASNDRPHPRLGPPVWNVNGLAPEAGIERTVHAKALPAYLQDAGYHTIHVGKAHFGAIGTPASDPRTIGFDVNIAGHAAGGPGSFYAKDDFSASKRERNPSNDRVWDVPGLEKFHGSDLYLTEALTLEAIEAMGAAVEREERFFLYLSHYAVHAPLMPDPKYIDLYPDLPPAEAAYASMIEGMDASLGAVLDALEELEVAEDTLVLFLSDNGGLSHAARGGERFSHNRPLSAGKGSAHEGGVRVPMIAAWPGVTAPASRCDTPVTVEDWFASLLTLTGQELPETCDGRSFLPLLRGEETDASDRRLVWHQPNHWTGGGGPGLGPHSSLRLGAWKLIWYHDPERPERVELFHLGEDLGERNNRADEQPERVARMKQILTEELKAYGAQLPVRKDTGAPIAWPDGSAAD